MFLLWCLAFVYILPFLVWGRYLKYPWAVCCLSVLRLWCSEWEGLPDSCVCFYFNLSELFVEWSSEACGDRWCELLIAAFLLLSVAGLVLCLSPPITPSLLISPSLCQNCSAWPLLSHCLLNQNFDSSETRRGEMWLRGISCAECWTQISALCRSLWISYPQNKVAVSKFCLWLVKAVVTCTLSSPITAQKELGSVGGFVVGQDCPIVHPSHISFLHLP